ncbi:tryptophan synthase subunit alpha [Oleiphilus messinensis]|uniref:Tryptophan synthase alpha chain n=1 Tax=Oleiphilus messinensis TaxID=141451 RepID=A0A1Y0ID55_9GAMM|nr:tryptophan synthase subunit alpha [Oleiphilus messinensis]ARU57313.1 tryptophan synthase subunit alpha [Oleiphilus messinensis]
MSRIAQTFETLKEQNKKALIPYITAGDPNPGLTLSLMQTLVDAGADVIELGVPFSDPMADGPVIQLACERALEHNTSLRDVLGIVKAFRETDQTTPVVLMGYLNPIEVMGYEQFVSAAKEAGVDGVLTVDLPPEEAETFCLQLKNADLDAIFLLAPTTDNDRISSICHYSTGYVYYVSVKGVTGSGALDVAGVEEKLAEIKAKTDLPVGVGFGIKDAKSAAAVAQVADGIIVGSALVNRIAEFADRPDELKAALHQILSEMRAAIDA